MTRNVWNFLHLSNPGYLHKNPEEHGSKYENLTFKTKPFIKQDGTVKANKGNKYKPIVKINLFNIY